MLWKEAAEVVAPSMEQALRTCPGQGTLVLGPEWHTAQMCLMPKPGKPLKSVSDLRPIALLSPFAKSLAKMAANRLRPYVQRADPANPRTREPVNPRTREPVRQRTRGGTASLRLHQWSPGR